MSVPALQLRCAIACVTDADADGAETCHYDKNGPGQTQTVSAKERCCRDVVVTANPARTIAREPLSIPALTFDVAVLPQDPATTARFAQPGADIRPPGGPPASFVAPLRV
jgi:hypothetical protein